MTRSISEMKSRILDVIYVHCTFTEYVVSLNLRVAAPNSTKHGVKIGVKR